MSHAGADAERGAFAVGVMTNGQEWLAVVVRAGYAWRRCVAVRSVPAQAGPLVPQEFFHAARAHPT
jgi:hypothetical protein